MCRNCVSQSKKECVEKNGIHDDGKSSKQIANVDYLEHWMITDVEEEPEVGKKNLIQNCLNK